MEARDRDAERLVAALVAAWNAHDLDAVAACLDEGFENHQLPLGVAVGRDAYLCHLEAWFTGYPDLAVELRTCFAVDGRVCAEVVESGTRSGPFAGAEPTGARETFFGCDVFEVRDGRIAIQRGYWDFSVGTGRLAPRAGGGGPDGGRYFRPG